MGVSTPLKIRLPYKTNSHFSTLFAALVVRCALLLQCVSRLLVAGQPQLWILNPPDSRREHSASSGGEDMTSKMAALQGEAHFFEESMNPGKVKEYLSRPKVGTTISLRSTCRVEFHCCIYRLAVYTDLLCVPRTIQHSGVSFRKVTLQSPRLMFAWVLLQKIGNVLQVFAAYR